MSLQKKLIFFQTKAIGHLMCEPDLFIKSARLGMRENFHGVLYASHKRFANRHIIQYWQDFPEHLTIVDRDLEYNRLSAIPGHERFFFDCHREYMVRLNKCAKYQEIIRGWRGRSPLLRLKPEDAAFGWRVLQQAGIPEGAPFFLFHSREPGYDRLGFNDFRNTRIETFLPAIEYLTSLGFWCIRMGDSSMKPLTWKMPRVFDYATSKLKGEEMVLRDTITMPGGFKDIKTIEGRMDVFLGATAKAFLNSDSGVGMLAQTFGVPVCWTNLAPTSFAPFYGNNDITLPRLMWSETEERHLNFPEVFGSPVANFRSTSDFQRARIKPAENTPEELLEAARELVEKAEGRIAYTPEEESRQETWNALMGPEHFSYQPAARIGRAFLKRHSNLLMTGAEQRITEAKRAADHPQAPPKEHSNERGRRILIKYGHLFTPGPNSVEFLRQVADCLNEIGATDAAQSLLTQAAQRKLLGRVETLIKSGVGLIPEKVKDRVKHEIARRM